MTWFTAFIAGLLLGLIHFSGLWLTVRQVMRHPRRQSWLAASRLVRLLLIGGGFVWLAQHGAIAVLWGLGGWWCARGFVLLRVQERRHAHQ